VAIGMENGEKKYSIGAVGPACRGIG
jgi:hypothetical protein